MKNEINKENAKHAAKRTVIIAILLAIIIFLIKIAPNYVEEKEAEGIKLIINNKNVTSNLKNEIINEEGMYLSFDDVKNFFDEDIVNENGDIITTSNTKTVKLYRTGRMYVNGSYIHMDEKILEKENELYISLEEMKDIYNLEYNYNEDNKTLVIDSLSKKFVQAVASKNIKVKFKATPYSKTVEKIKRGDSVCIVQDAENDSDFEVGKWVRVRTLNGNIGYVKKSKLISRTVVRENLDDTKIDGNVSLAWDYYSSGRAAPTRTEKIEGINVVSPSFYELKSDGTLSTNIGQSGENYIKWAHDNGYEVWPTISNSMLNNLDTVSKIMSSFDSRARLIDNIMDTIVNNDIDGINLDFENMYKEDKDKYSRFVIELTPRLHEMGMKLCVDVTEPDGSDTWSLCYDRNKLGKIADYIVFIGYDQHTGSSPVAGSVASADWVEINIKKFLGQEGIPKEKLILAIPFYTRLWKEQNEKLTSTVVNMNQLKIPENVRTRWDEKAKQYYMEYEQNSAKYKMWIEDKESVSAKLDLVNQYNLKGAGFWEIDRETEDIWPLAKEKLDVK